MAIASSVEIRPNPYAAMAAGHRPTMQGDVASAMDFMAVLNTSLKRSARSGFSAAMWVPPELSYRNA